jgi:hypothetical protein
MTNPIKIDKVNRIIQKTVTGELHTERSLRLVREASMAASLHKDYNVLMDLRETVTGPAMLDLMAIASACSELNFDANRKIAFLIPDAADRVRFARLFRTCMETQGLNFKQFFDYDAAMRWLAG